MDIEYLKAGLPISYEDLKKDNARIRVLQSLLKDKGFYRGKLDGIWGYLTERAIKEAADKLYLNTENTKIVGNSLVEGVLKLENAVYKNEPSREEIKALCDKYKIEIAVFYAVRDVESGGKYLENGRPIIRFEGHQFYIYTKGRYAKSHPHICYPRYNPNKNNLNQSGMWDIYNVAFGLAPWAAAMSTSWGAFQIMGFNHKSVGYDLVQEFTKAMYSPINQIEAFFEFCKTYDLLEFLRTKNWTKFAIGYNGPSFDKVIPAYDERLRRAFKKYQ